LTSDDYEELLKQQVRRFRARYLIDERAVEIAVKR
jgi:hypothetical protein